ncbi:effector-associated domain 2-containing protein [Yinghuangia aomiensis]
MSSHCEAGPSRGGRGLGGASARSAAASGPRRLPSNEPVPSSSRSAYPDGPAARARGTCGVARVRGLRIARRRTVARSGVVARGRGDRGSGRAAARRRGPDCAHVVEAAFGLRPESDPPDGAVPLDFPGVPGGPASVGGGTPRVLATSPPAGWLRKAPAGDLGRAAPRRTAAARRGAGCARALRRRLRRCRRRRYARPRVRASPVGAGRAVVARPRRGRRWFVPGLAAGRRPGRGGRRGRAGVQRRRGVGPGTRARHGRPRRGVRGNRGPRLVDDPARHPGRDRVRTPRRANRGRGPARRPRRCPGGDLAVGRSAAGRRVVPGRRWRRSAVRPALRHRRDGAPVPQPEARFFRIVARCDAFAHGPRALVDAVRQIEGDTAAAADFTAHARRAWPTRVDDDG